MSTDSDITAARARYAAHMEAFRGTATYKDSPYWTKAGIWDKMAQLEDAHTIASDAVAAPVVQQGLEACVAEVHIASARSWPAQYGEVIDIIRKHWPAPASPSEVTELADRLEFLHFMSFHDKMPMIAAMLRKLASDNERLKGEVDTQRGKADWLEQENEGLRKGHINHLEIATLQAELTALRSSHAALVKLWKHTPKIDNGRCMVCRIGYTNWQYGGVNDSPKVGPCSDERCLSHVVTKALSLTEPQAATDAAGEKQT